jgi:hypothetical protein
MGAKIKLTVGGKEVSPENFGSAMKAQVFEHLKDSITKKLSQIKCPEHGGVPKVTAEGNSLDNVKWQISGCCEKLREEALKAIPKK